MGYHNMLSDLSLRFSIKDLVNLSNELRKDDTIIFKNINNDYHETEIINANEAIKFLIKYFGYLYLSDMKEVDEFNYHIEPDDENLFNIKYEGSNVQILINSNEFCVHCFKMTWHGSSDSDNKYGIMSKYCTPFKLLVGYEEYITQLFCFNGKIINKVLVDYIRDSGNFNQKELLEIEHNAMNPQL